MKLHIANSIVIEMNGKRTTLGQGEYEFGSANEFIKFIEGLGEQPKEPLIKDEKIRKAVRAWAEANSRDSFKVVNEHFNCCKIIGYTQNGIADGGSRIEFGTTIAGAKQKYFYTLAELCGEEEE